MPSTYRKTMHDTAPLAVGFATLVQAQTDRYDALANSAMVENRPTPETGKLLKEELLFQRGSSTATSAGSPSTVTGAGAPRGDRGSAAYTSGGERGPFVGGRSLAGVQNWCASDYLRNPHLRQFGCRNLTRPSRV